jgi:hypothetical protein
LWANFDKIMALSGGKSLWLARTRTAIATTRTIARSARDATRDLVLTIFLSICASRTFRLHEKANLQLLAEAFNITNRTNYASVNNVVGPDFGLLPGFTTFNVSGSAALSPSHPLGFTSALPKREIQLAFRLDF